MSITHLEQSVKPSQLQDDDEYREEIGQVGQAEFGLQAVSCE